MKLSHFELEQPIHLSSSTPNVLVIENENKMYEFCNDILKQADGEDGTFIMYDASGKAISFAKDIKVIFDFFNYSLKDRKSQSLLISEMNEIVNNSLLEEYAELVKGICLFFDKLNGESEFEIDYDIDAGLSALLKAYGLSWKNDRENLSDTLISLLQFYSRISKVKCIIFINLKCFLNADGVAQLYREAIIEDIPLLLIESTMRQNVHGEKITVLDKDLCEIIVK